MIEFLLYIQITSTNPSLTKSYHKDLIKQIESLLNNGADINTKDDNSFCLLDYLYETESIKFVINHGGIGRISTYNTYREYFSEEQQNAFDSFLLLTNENHQFFEMCLAYQEGIKNNVEIDVRDMELL